MLSSQQPTVAVVEDDPILREEIAHFLRGAHFLVHEVNNGLSLDELLSLQRIDAVILDVNLPGNSGFEIAARVRNYFPQIGIVMLTARTGLPDRLRGYEVGADIYLPKPTHPQELLAAVNNLIRRLNTQQLAVSWVLDSQRRSLQYAHNTDPVFLTAAETALLMALIQAPNHTLQSDVICELICVRDQADPLTKRALENMVSRLRKKISELLVDKTEPTIRSVWGLGYQLALPMTIRHTR